MKWLNVFKGNDAVLDFLNPDKNVPLPLVEVPKTMNPFYDDGVRIYAKLMNMHPLGNLKSLPAFNMMENASKKGSLEKGGSLIESSSGNTVLSLAVLARLRGINDTKAFISSEVLEGKLQLLRLFGVNPIVNEEPICPDPGDESSGIYRAKEIGKRIGWFNPGQYENEFNPESHEKWTGKQIWEQLGGDIQLFCAGLGTTGTMLGCSRFFKQKNKKTMTVGVARTPNNHIPGVRTEGLLDMVAFDWKSYVDSVEEIGTKDSFQKSLELIRSGLMVGPSSGFSFAGLLNKLKSLKDKGEFPKLKNQKGEINSVFICCDSPLPYLDEYFLNLGEDRFPKVENENLLSKKPNKYGSERTNENLYEISPFEAYNMVYEKDKDSLWKSIVNGKRVNTKKNLVLIDVRSQKEFNHFCLLGSENIPYSKIMKDIKENSQKLRNKKAIIICNKGVKSNLVSNALREEGVESYSLKGGITQWSNFDLPRWKPENCFRS